MILRRLSRITAGFEEVRINFSASVANTVTSLSLKYYADRQVADATLPTVDNRSIAFISRLSLATIKRKP